MTSGKRARPLIRAMLALGLLGMGLGCGVWKVRLPTWIVNLHPQKPGAPKLGVFGDIWSLLGPFCVLQILTTSDNPKLEHLEGTLRILARDGVARYSGAAGDVATVSELFLNHMRSMPAFSSKLEDFPISLNVAE